VRPQAHQSSAAEARPRPEDASAGESRPGFDPRGHDIEVSRQYHNGAYRHPQGYEDRRWGHGDHLPPQYYGHEYWIEDFAAFGLFEPPPYMIWIRVGNDALLIDEDSGEIIQVAREVFY
jgi:Ni/Co efflux regulator RcnB